MHVYLCLLPVPSFAQKGASVILQRARLQQSKTCAKHVDARWLKIWTHGVSVSLAIPVSFRHLLCLFGYPVVIIIWVEGPY